MIDNDGRLYTQQTSSGTISAAPASSDRKVPGQGASYSYQVYGACNHNNGMGGPESRSAKYHEQTLL